MGFNIKLALIGFFLTCGILAPTAKVAKAYYESTHRTPKNVILITWDGIRRHEFLNSAHAFNDSNDADPTLPYLWEVLASKGEVYGNPNNDGIMTIANTEMMSLPGYQGIMAGFPQLCFGNECGRIKSETFPERFVRKEGFIRESVAAISSWAKINDAVQSQEGVIVTNTGMESFTDHVCHDEEVDSINHAQANNPPPWEGAKYDSYTHQQALRYLKKHKPRFMFISYNDSDEWAHRGQYGNYIASIRTYDRWLKETVETLESMGEYGKDTCLIVTTDHGRGDGEKWTSHNNGLPESAFVMMYAGCPLDQNIVFKSAEGRTVSHLNIRPTIEQLVGVKPQECLFCGTSLLD